MNVHDFNIQVKISLLINSKKWKILVNLDSLNSISNQDHIQDHHINKLKDLEINIWLQESISISTNNPYSLSKEEINIYSIIKVTDILISLLVSPLSQSDTPIQISQKLLPIKLINLCTQLQFIWLNSKANIQKLYATNLVLNMIKFSYVTVVVKLMIWQFC
jgi:hypothetical protein